MINFPCPTTTTEIKRFVGLCSWFCRFIKDFSSIMSRINDVLKGKKEGQPINWTFTAEVSFLKITH